MIKKMLLSTLLFKFDIHIGAVLIDKKNNDEGGADGISYEPVSDDQIEIMKSNVFPESCTHLPQGIHSFCFSINSSNDTTFCYTAFLSIPNANSERLFDQYSYVIATKLPFYPLFLRLLDSINLIVDSINPHEIFTLLAEFVTKWGKHLSLITFSKPSCPKNDSYGINYDSSFSSGSSSTSNSSDTSNSDSSDSSNNFVNATNIIDSNLYNILTTEFPIQSNLNKSAEQNSNSVELEIIRLDQSSATEKSIMLTDSNANSYSNPTKDFSMMMNLNLKLCVSTRFELPLFNGVVPINPHPKFTRLLSTQSTVYCANPCFIGSDLITDIEDDFEGALMLWESCITDQPVVIIASTPRKATNASFAVASLSYPEEPPISIIPYMSITDKRFKELSEKPKGIIGFSNPIAENLFIQRSKIIRVGFDKKSKSDSNKGNNIASMKRNSSANIHFNMSNNNNININQNQNESSINYTNLSPANTKNKNESYASYTNSPLPPSKPVKMIKSQTMQMSLPNQSPKINPIQRSQSMQNQMNFKELNSAQIRYQLYQNTNRLRKAITEAIDTQISGDILNVLLNNFNLSIIDNRLRANAVLYSSPCIEFVSFLIKSRLFKRICKERLSTASAVSKFIDLDIDNLNPDIAKKIFNSMFHVIQEQNIVKELEKAIKKKLRKIVPLFQHKQQKENAEMMETSRTDHMKTCNNEIPSS